MKYAIVIPDGCADEPQDSLDGRTPLQAAQTPNMDAVVRTGLIGRADHVPASMPSGSDVGTMSLFGYDPLKYHTGRAPIEAAAQGIELGPNDWAIRCNLVTIQEERMISFTAGQIPNDLAHELIGLLQKDQCGSATWKFHAGVSYRNLLIYRGRNQQPPFSKDTLTTPPHDLIGQPIHEYLPQGPGALLLRDLMDCSSRMFAQSERNESRRVNGELPATGVWLWGLGTAPAMETFRERFGIAAAVITAVDLLRGLARLIGWQVVDVPGATGYTDTDYAAKGRYAVDILQNVDLVAVHVEATDEASHEGDAQAKIRALERIDEEIVGPVHEFLKCQGEYRILISPDHPTLLRTRTHSHGYVPFAMAGAGVAAGHRPKVGPADSYDEVAAARSTIELQGCKLMELLLRSDETSTAAGGPG